MIKKFFIVFLLLITLSYTFFASILFNFLQIYINPDFYLNNTKIFIQPMINEQITAKLIEDNPEIEKYLDKKEIIKEFNLLFSENWIKTNIKDFFNQLADFEKEKILTISLREIKTDIPAFISSLSLKIVNKLPSCTNTKELNLEDSLPNCLPKNVDEKQFAEQMGKNLNNEKLSYLSDEIVLSDSRNQQIILILKQIFTYRVHLQLVTILIFILLLIVIALLSPSLSSLLIFNGITLFLSTLTILGEIIMLQNLNFFKERFQISKDLFVFIDKPALFFINNLVIMGEILAIGALICITANIFRHVRLKK